MKQYTILMMKREMVRDLPCTNTGNQRVEYITDNAHNYVEVAEVWASDLDDVYRLTQNIDSSWQDNFEVDVLPEVQGNVAYKRSTMIGDVIKSLDYTYSAIESVGFIELENGLE